MLEFSSRTATKLRIGAGCALLSTSLFASMPWEAWASDATTRGHGERVLLFGRPLERPADPSATATSLAARFLDARVAVITGDARIEGTRRELGVSVDEARLSRWLTEAFDDDSALAEARDSVGASGPVDLLVPTRFDASVLVDKVAALADRTNRAPVDARMDPETGTIVEDRPGLRLDVDATIEAFERSLESNAIETRAVIREVAASRTTAMLRGASVRSVLGEFETRYNPAQNAADRTHNLAVAASRIDGRVLLPGEVFDFNAVVGERSEANGFREAPVIEAGEIDLGVGGGTCQISGTLHAAVFFAGLTIVDRQPHSRPSSYIKLGLDAMVVWPEKNFVFRNDFAHPVVLRITVAGGTVRAEVRAEARTKMVSFVRRIDDVIPYEERIDEDPSLPAGVRVLVQRGMPGFRLTRFRVVRDVTTQQATRERSRDQYPPTVQIWRVGTGGAVPAEFVPPPNDPHPEYRADELLEVVQGPGVEGTVEYATAGRTGIAGWTRTMGMPFAE